MAAYHFEMPVYSASHVQSPRRSAAIARKHILRHRLVAFAPTAASVVENAGGWMFDRVMAGWDVTVVVTDHVDTRPLEILGVRVVDLESAMTSKIRGPHPDSIAFDSGLCDVDNRFRVGVPKVFDGGLANEVTLWGVRKWDDDRRSVAPVEYRLSVAALAFKTYALSAISDSCQVGHTERFHTSGIINRSTTHEFPDRRGELRTASRNTEC